MGFAKPTGFEWSSFWTVGLQGSLESIRYFEQKTVRLTANSTAVTTEATIEATVEAIKCSHFEESHSANNQLLFPGCWKQLSWHSDTIPFRIPYWPFVPQRLLRHPRIITNSLAEVVGLATAPKLFRAARQAGRAGLAGKARLVVAKVVRGLVEFWPKKPLLLWNHHLSCCIPQLIYCRLSLILCKLVSVDLSLYFSILNIALLDKESFIFANLLFS
jgi:hypothetical protein